MADLPASQAVTDFLGALPPGRRDVIAQVRDVILHHLPLGYEEAISKNMLVYQVPLGAYSNTYNGHPLWYVALASEKSYCSLHLMPVYGDTGLAGELKAGFERAGKTLNMGKACIHFHTLDDLALDVVGSIVARVPMEKWIALARAARTGSTKSRR